MNDLLDRLRAARARLSRRQQLQIACAVVTLAGLVWGASVWATRVRYEVLFSGLEPEQAAAVTAALLERRVDHRVGEDGAAIEVPAGKVEELRLDLASEGLPPGAGVSMIDGAGHLLSEELDPEGPALSASRIELRRAMERGIETTLVSLLEPIVGSGRVRARATVELSLQRVHRVEESYDPDVALVRSEQRTKVRHDNSASHPPRGGDAPSGQETHTSTTAFELNKTTATIAEPAGTMVRQSVAVVVDHALPAAPGEGDAAPAARPRTDEEMTTITDLVRAAIGFDEERGDVLIVENVPFGGRVDENAGMEHRSDWAPWLPVLRDASLPLAVLLLAFLVIRPAIAALASLRTIDAGEARAPLTVAQLQERLRAEIGRDGTTAADGGTTRLRRRLIEAAQDDPRAAALVIKRWLDDDATRRG